MVLDKTGGLFRLALGLMAAFSSESRHKYNTLIDRLALYFQIRDDFVNLRSDEYMHSKSYCEDITEGKFSFPIIRALHARPDDTRLLAILKQRTNDNDLKRHAVQFMEKTGAFEYTRAKLCALRADIEQDIATLGGHPTLTKLIDHLDRQLTSTSFPSDSHVAVTSSNFSSCTIDEEEREMRNEYEDLMISPPSTIGLQRARSDVDPLS
eukprot:CAMPEP_0197287718 /NCGR_PEP_ID=MMETSP0890-20130614/4350_1 /TAXON_ID=44058 ORGANISM="Aureoumbra lagunensis, Strain CCMP1510" /NCGR_SAMPLE_ID=MMETSP0890 /ASSEMBLY_ACC=CAM_ASM_000533 /LENGTH=208 /DNA_ID=CAMNT_0042757723 /DNA_START=468 /DNA_END=1094 /DNA_ORIENTATION=+